MKYTPIAIPCAVSLQQLAPTNKRKSAVSQFSEHWSPRTIAQLNQYDIMVVQLKNELVWHKHDNTDDFFIP